MSLRTRYRLYHLGNRIQVFFLGFLLGVILCGGFFLLKLDSYVKELALVKTLTGNSDQKEQEEEAVSDDAKEPSSKKSSKSGKSKADEMVVAVADSVSDEMNGDTALPAVYNGSDEDLVVKKDELLGEKNVPLVSLDVSTVADSLRSREAGINNDPAKNFTVEFWRSPLNYKGYKLTRSRLVLFGFTAEDQIALYKLENVMYMKSPGGIFRLENTSDFRPLERVTDDAVLARLK